MKWILMSLIFPLLAQADYAVGYGVGAFMGRHQLQGEYVSENQRHHTLGILGYTSDDVVGDIKQYSVVYQWAMRDVKAENFRWTPLMSGVFATYTDNPYYFVDTPERYNDDDYYDPTSLRYGLRFSTAFNLVRKSDHNIRFLIDGNLLERALSTFFNNSSETKMFKAFWSLGFSVRIDI